MNKRELAIEKAQEKLRVIEEQLNFIREIKKDKDFIKFDNNMIKKINIYLSDRNFWKRKILSLQFELHKEGLEKV